MIIRMKFADLLRRDDLGIAVVTAEPDVLERAVTGAYITDLPDPSRFLSMGDVVLTSGVWMDRPGAVATFVDALARQRVAGLIVGLVHIGAVPDELIAECRARRVVLATVPERVSFRTVADAVSSAQDGSRSGLVAKGLRFATRLSELLGAGAAAPDVLGEFHTEFALPVWLLDGLGTVLSDSGAPLPRRDAGLVWNAVLAAADGAPVFVPGDDASYTAWPIPGTGRRAVGYVVVDGDQRRLARDAPLIVDAVVSALRVDLELSARWREAGHSHVSELVQVLAQDSASPGEISARMRLEGLDPRAATRVAIAEVSDPDFPPSAVLEMAYRLLAHDDARIVGCVIDDRAVLIVNGDPRDPDEGDVARATEEYLPFLAGRHLRVGVSDPRSGVGSLGAAIDNAQERLRGIRGDAPVVIAAMSVTRSHRDLLAQMGERARAEFANEVLRPLIDYDGKHGADLVRTLRVFLANSGAWQESARQLQLHTNTMRYRIARVEELTSRDLGTMQDRVDLFLALACLDSAGPRI